jgi:hypothetical protein
MRIRIQIQGFGDQKFKKKLQLQKILRLYIKNCYLLIPRPPFRTAKLQEKPLALKRKHPALQKMKFFLFFSFGSYLPSRIRIQWTKINADLDPKHCLFLRRCFCCLCSTNTSNGFTTISLNTGLSSSSSILSSVSIDSLTNGSVTLSSGGSGLTNGSGGGMLTSASIASSLASLMPVAIKSEPPHSTAQVYNFLLAENVCNFT